MLLTLGFFWSILESTFTPIKVTVTFSKSAFQNKQVDYRKKTNKQTKNLPRKANKQNKPNKKIHTIFALLSVDFFFPGIN